MKMKDIILWAFTYKMKYESYCSCFDNIEPLQKYKFNINEKSA